MSKRLEPCIMTKEQAKTIPNTHDTEYIPLYFTCIFGRCSQYLTRKDTEESYA